MKYLLPILIFTITAQSQHNFKFENILIWQKVYNHSTTIEDLNLQLKQLGINSSIENNTISFDQNYTTEILKQHGYKVMNYPIYLGYGGFYKGIIEFKENSYRVTITKIEVIDAEQNFKDISFWLVKSNQIETKKNPVKVMELLDSYFTKTFQLKNKNDW
jgi:hypothetical protein